NYLRPRNPPAIFQGESSAIPVLIDLFEDADVDVRLAALSFAASTSTLRGQSGLLAAPQLMQVITQGEDQRARARATFTLVSIGPDLALSLIAALRASSPFVRKAAAYALGQFGEAGKEAVPALLNALEDEDEEVHRDAEIALFLIDRKAARAAGID